jgi:UDP-glucose 4-epimerase
MKILVVGGAGFIGSHLVDRLLAEQHTVDVVDDLSTGTLANLAVARSMGGDLKIHHLDVCADEFASLVSMREPEVIVHLGWLPPGRSRPAVQATAVHAALNVLDAARASGVAKVVTAVSATALYGDVPARELPVKEGRAPAPLGTDGVVTQAVVELLALHRSQHDVEFTALAMAEVYGTRQRADGGLVAGLVAAHRARQAAMLAGDGRQARDFVFIDDVVDALVRSLHRGSGLVVNIGTGTLTTVRDLWSAIAGPDAAAASLPARDDEPLRLSVSPTRARIHLAWAPWTDLATGLRALTDA